MHWGTVLGTGLLTSQVWGISASWESRGGRLLGGGPACGENVQDRLLSSAAALDRHTSKHLSSRKDCRVQTLGPNQHGDPY